MTVEAVDVWSDLVALIEARSDYQDSMHDYYIAEQPLPIDAAELKSKFGASFANFRNNLARPIIDSAEGRVRIQEFGDEEATRIYKSNNLAAESKYMHTDAMVMGHAYAIVLPREDDTAGIWPQQTMSCAVLYSDEDPRNSVCGMKYWSEVIGEKAEFWIRVNLYFEDRIERYISTRPGRALESDFEKYVPYSTGDVTESEVHSVGEVPMFEFRANWDMTNQDARSDLHDAAPMIDAINKTFLDMMVASEYTAAPQRWATGVEIPMDPETGKPLQSYEAGADQLWTAANDTAKFGQFTPGQLTAYKAAIDTLVDHLVYVSRTPKYALAGESKYSSGENLRVIESPLRSRVSDHQQVFTNTWQRIMIAAMKLESVEVGEEFELDILWLPANAPFFTTERLEELKMKVEVAGIPQEQIWKEMGYSDTEVERMKEMRDEEAEIFNEFDAAASVALGAADPLADEPPAGLASET